MEENLSDKKIYHIGEVAKRLGITTRTIRYYEEIGLLEPAHRLEAGARVYSDEDIKRLKFILKLKELGVSLKEMKRLAKVYEAYKNPKDIMPALIEILDFHIAKIDDKIAKLASLRNDIVDYKAKVLEIMKNKEGKDGKREWAYEES